MTWREYLRGPTAPQMERMYVWGVPRKVLTTLEGVFVVHREVIRDGGSSGSGGGA